MIGEIGPPSGTAHPARTPVSPRRTVDDVGTAGWTHRRWRNGAYRRQARVLEETGYGALHWKRILHFYVSPGFSTKP